MGNCILKSSRILEKNGFANLHVPDSTDETNLLLRLLIESVDLYLLAASLVSDHHEQDRRIKSWSSRNHWRISCPRYLIYLLDRSLTSLHPVRSAVFHKLGGYTAVLPDDDQGILEKQETFGNILLAVISFSLAAPVDEANAEVKKLETNVYEDGFKYTYETSNAIAAEAEGTLKKFPENSAVVVKGSFDFITPDGGPVHFTYVADENGYQPQSDILPVGPEIPAYITRALEWIAAHPPKE
ncbi:Larval cuticle protein LCP-17 [Eumeta japonica]|uniref:Larval cuticle protein LCP-17 n=1 Tax=Eumeta variegata TaxID=151549 RepID=A0A4C1ZS68_EUMVA|nr:Larval cuticle protein LCP-17 [Eumeta japonica]